DITGLFDKNGATVVEYTYDSWGKLISISGSLASSVGVKNPYRYRGYRYDAESQLYYLQSRYYNPEFCRMLNADALVGSTGELLGHNMFAYTKNNPINMSDPSGFRPIFSTSLAEETEDMKAASFAIMNRKPVSSVVPKKKRAMGYVDKVLQLSGTNTGQAAVATGNTGIGTAIGNFASKAVGQKFKPISNSIMLNGMKKVPFKIQSFKYSLAKTDVIGKGSSAIGAAGLLSVGLLGVQAVSNVYHYGLAEGAGRTGIDALGFAAGCVAGSIIGGLVVAGTVGIGGSIVIGIGVSFIIGGAVNKAKEYFFE
ncbi:RHS repeat domain-containing protein, partial [Clostridium grantii]